MKLTLKNFKCYDERTFIFQEGITLIKGDSGCGKSTIFDAISWVLYGLPKTVVPLHDKNKKTSVIFEFEGILFQRSKKPELLQITVSNDVLVDDIAQHYINEHFGPYHVWKSCSYLSQFSRNSLISLSSSERFNILYYLAFGTDKTTLIEDYYTKLDDEISKLEVKCQVSKKILEKCELELLPSFEYSPIEILDNKLLEYQVKLSNLKVKEKERTILISKQERIIQNLKLFLLHRMKNVLII